MKNNFFKTATLILTFLVMNVTIFAQSKTTGIAYNSNIDLNKIEANIPAKADVVIQNNNSKPLIIENVMTTCGCTIANYTKRPIKKGKTGTVSLTYNASQGLGYFTKTIYVKFSGVADAQPITITGEVVAATELKKNHLATK